MQWLQDLEKLRKKENTQGFILTMAEMCFKKLPDMYMLGLD